MYVILLSGRSVQRDLISPSASKSTVNHQTSHLFFQPSSGNPGSRTLGDIEGLRDIEGLGNIEGLKDTEGLWDTEGPADIEGSGDIEGPADNEEGTGGLGDIEGPGEVV